MAVIVEKSLLKKLIYVQIISFVFMIFYILSPKFFITRLMFGGLFNLATLIFSVLGILFILLGKLKESNALGVSLFDQASSREKKSLSKIGTVAIAIIAIVVIHNVIAGFLSFAKILTPSIIDTTINMLISPFVTAVSFLLGTVVLPVVYALFTWQYINEFGLNHKIGKKTEVVNKK